MNITNYVPVIVRYAIVSLMAAMFTHGWVTDDQNAILTQNIDIIVSALVGLLTVAYALIKRPSAKALDAAKVIDQELPKHADVEIVTP
ncbi:MAG TPA: hypothetical protein VL202_12990, partial [Pararhizobium sp.]|uniref:Pam3-gp28 family putative phage holin n=1 Tax=Pararhizobium sp. TaxID=1977563 RepID=UPI002C493AEA